MATVRRGVGSATGSSDWRRRAQAVRDLPLDAILLERCAERSPHDKSKWHTERGWLSLTGNKFHNWCLQVGGGGAIDLIMHLANVDFREAVVWLEQRFGSSHTEPLARHSGLLELPPPPAIIRSSSTTKPTGPVARQLVLPAPDPSQLNRVQRYLTERRRLPEALLEPLIAVGKLYADHRGNAVFLLVAGKAQRPIGAELRGTGPQVWRGLAPGTDKNAGFFWIGDAEARGIVLCESAIDAISCRALIPECLAISTAGARPAPRWLSGLIARGNSIHCGYDTDEAGERAAAAMLALHPTITRLPPPAHDWNDALVAHLATSK